MERRLDQIISFNKYKDTNKSTEIPTNLERTNNPSDESRCNRVEC